MSSTYNSPTVAGVTVVGGGGVPTAPVTQTAAVDLKHEGGVWKMPAISVAGVSISATELETLAANFRTTLSSLSSTDWATLVSHLANTGMDPKTVRSNIMAFLLRFPVTASVAGEMTRVDALGNLILLYCFQMGRGTKFEKALNTTSQTGKDLVRKALAVFAPVFTVGGGTNVPKHMLNPSRMVPVFPDIAFVVACNIPMKFENHAPAGFPKQLCYPGSGAVIPSKFNNLRDAYIHFCWALDTILRNVSLKNDQEIKDRKKRVADYATMALNSPILSDSNRENFLKSIGLVADIAALPAKFDISVV
jgi:hypothetical protein